MRPTRVAVGHNSQARPTGNDPAPSDPSAAGQGLAGLVRGFLAFEDCGSDRHDANDGHDSPYDTASLNLRCAEHPPGAEEMDSEVLLRTVTQWTEMVRLSTARLLPRFRTRPEEFHGSEGYFRMLVLVTVLQRSLGVQYRPECMEGPWDCSDSRTLFLHGLLTGYGGTRASMPILNLAIGRRLGYPLKLVGAKQHLFLRWEDPSGERFNVECSSRGLNSYPDAYYHTWPVPLTEYDLAHGYYLRSFTPREELACFLVARGHCLRDNLDLPRAIDAYWHTCQLAPRDPNYRGFLAIATVLHRDLSGVVRYGLSTPGAQTHALENGAPRPLEPWETWAVPEAHEELRRIEAIHTAKRAGECPVASIDTRSL